MVVFSNNLYKSITSQICRHYKKQVMVIVNVIYLKVVKRVNPKCSHHKEKNNGLAWWPSGKESMCQCRRQGFDPWF